MVSKGVITPETRLTEWVNGLTYPQKPDGTLYVCLYPWDLSKAILQAHSKPLTLNEISHKPKIFSKLYSKNDLWCIHLNKAISLFTMFHTHKGRYRFLRMPFGLKMSQNVFQMGMEQLTYRLLGIITIYEDICIFGSTHQEHNQSLSR